MQVKHPRKCDCARCQPPTQFHNSLGLDVDFLDPEERESRNFEAREAQEKRVLRRIISTGQKVLYLELDDHFNAEDKEVTVVLDDILTRFHDGSEFFSTLEIQIAAQEMAHTIEGGKKPANALLRFLLGSIISFCDQSKQMELTDFLKANDEGSKDYSHELIREMNVSYERWLKKAQSTSELWLVRFAKDRTSTLVDPSQENRRGPDMSTSGKTPQGVAKLSDNKIREIMVRNEAEEKKRYPEIFNVQSGSGFGRVKPPYWPVAFATDDKGRRYLSDRVLEAILPGWEKILSGESSRSLSGYKRNWLNLASELEKWRVHEKEKLNGLDVDEWPPQYGGRRSEFGDPGRPSQVWSRVKPVNQTSANDADSNSGSNAELSREESSSELARPYQDQSKFSSRAQSPAASSDFFTSRDSTSSRVGEGIGRQPIIPDLSSIFHEFNKLKERMESIQRALRNLKIPDLSYASRSASPVTSRTSPRWAPEPSVEPRSPSS